MSLKSTDSEPVQNKNEPFDFQKWMVYKRATELLRISDSISRIATKNGHRSLADQLRRASQSIVLNIAEGASRFTPRDKLSFLRIAKGSLFECVAAVDIAKELDLIDNQTRSKYCEMSAEIGKMLTGMIKAMVKRK